MHFWRGLVVALSNPKTIAFFTAFLPQFVDPSLPAGRQLAVMCVVSVVMAVFTDCGWAVAAGLGGLAAGGAIDDSVAWWAMLVAVVLTWVSGLDYARSAPRLLRGQQPA